MSPRSNVTCGFLPRGFRHVCPLVPITPAVVLFCIVPCCPLLVRGLTQLVIIFNANFFLRQIFSYLLSLCPEP